ncbi:hypothetical protein FE697_018890 [Mumia zhuanghuii]|uniref:Uncharacterized protein n=1 Tax=Mumia zhuanghuii TaxID=2585211 RepID=A0A5Q6RPL2_9ACTN|nr:hypothetical protein FE697_018890 [Mumia zhuanghuii]
MEIPIEHGAQLRWLLALSPRESTPRDEGLEDRDPTVTRIAAGERHRDAGKGARGCRGRRRRRRRRGLRGRGDGGRRRGGISRRGALAVAAAREGKRDRRRGQNPTQLHSRDLPARVLAKVRPIRTISGTRLRVKPLPA